MGQMGWIGSAVELAAPKRPSPILIFSIAMGADYLFELISIVNWVPQFIMYNKSILGGVGNARWTSKWNEW